jgi:MoxR-like ATPase
MAINKKGQVGGYLPKILTSDFVKYAAAMAEGGLAMMVYGPPGIGKTALALTLGHSQELVAWSNAKSGLSLDAIQVVHLSAPELNPEDLMGVPTIRELQRRMADGREETFRVTVWAIPQMFNPERPFVLFVDEPNRCDPSVRNALFQLITGKSTSGGFSLPAGSFVIMAGNRFEDRAGVKTLDNAFNGRAGHFNMEVDVDAWLEWALGAGLSPIVRAFIKRNPSQLADRFDADDVAPQKPMPRTWEAVGRIYASGRFGQDVKRTTAEALIGRGSAQLLHAYSKHESAIPDPDTIIKDPMAVRIPGISEIDTAWVLSMALSDHMTRDTTTPMNDPLGIGIAKILERLVENHPEPSTYALESARKRNTSEQRKPGQPAKVFLTVASIVGQQQRFGQLLKAIVGAS